MRFLPSNGSSRASKAVLILRDPDRRKISTTEYPLDLEAGADMELDFFCDDSNLSLTYPDRFGIWWINYELYDANGKLLQAEREGQRVVISKRLTGSDPDDISVAVNPLVISSLEGNKIPFRILAGNNGASQPRIYI